MHQAASAALLLAPLLSQAVAANAEEAAAAVAVKVPGETVTHINCESMSMTL